MQYYINKKITVLELGNALGLEVCGNREQIISEITSLNSNKNNALTFSTKKHSDFVDGVLIGYEGSKSDSLLISKAPRLDFCKAVQYLIDQNILVNRVTDSQIHESASIANTATIENGAVIGENTVIEHNVTIHQGSIIGNNSIIRANTVIGAQGFGFEKNSDGSWERFPHLGKVIIGNNVEIGALNSICVGALGNTVICDGVKTDNLVHIAHNCYIGKNSILTACTELSGGVTLGEGVWVGPNTSTMQKITIGSFAVVGLGSVVTKDVEVSHTVAGVPAKVIRRS